MAEVLTIIPFALQAIAAINQSVALFSRLQNAPEEIRLMQILLNQIKVDLEALQAIHNDGDPTTVSIPAEACHEVKNALWECEAFLTEYYNNVNGGTLRGVFWSKVKEATTLNRLKTRIANIYPLILMPLTLRVIMTRMLHHSGRGHGSGVHLQPTAYQSAALVSIVPPPPPDIGREVVHSIDDAPPNLRMQQERDLAEALRVRLLDSLETDGAIVDPSLELSGTTLKLQARDIPQAYRTLRLEKLEFAARDEESTVLRFTCHDGRGRRIQVKHLVPFVNAPCLDDTSSLNVYFRATHAITLMFEDGHHLYHVTDPRYSFLDVQARQKFQQMVRGRHLVGEIETIRIEVLTTTTTELENDDLDRVSTASSTNTSRRSSATSVFSSSKSSLSSFRSNKSKSKNTNAATTTLLLAQSEPIQIWRWDRPGSGWRVPSVVTMTFLADTGRKNNHERWRYEEWHAQDLLDEVRVEVQPSERERHPKKHVAVNLRWAVPRIQGGTREARITFGSKRDAMRFTKRFKLPKPHHVDDYGDVLGAGTRGESGQSTLPPIQAHDHLFEIHDSVQGAG